MMSDPKVTDIEERVKLQRSLEAAKKLIPSFPLDPHLEYSELYHAAVKWWGELRAALGEPEGE